MAARKPRVPKTEVCITVEKSGVWVYGNAQAFRQLADQIEEIARSEPSEHAQLLVKWHLGSLSSKRNPVFVLMDKEARRVHRRKEFDITFMVVEPADLKALRKQERSGRLPSTWKREI